MVWRRSRPHANDPRHVDGELGRNEDRMTPEERIIALGNITVSPIKSRPMRGQ
jgi:hypothetical protein